jgi:hypothetical protein
MKFFLVLLGVVVLFATAVPAVAGPGDPRLVNGILEWPRAVSNEPFVVVRGDDGVLYYVAIGAARHDASLAAGGRVVVLGLEGRTAHEINALGIGAGESVEAALANLQGARPSPAVAATTPAPTATAPAAPSPNGGAAAIAAPSAKPAPPAPPAAAAPAPNGKSAVAPTSPASTSPAAAVTPSAPTPSAPLVTAPAPTSPAVTAPAPTSPAVTAPAPTSPAPAVTPPPTGVGAPLIISTPTPSPVRSAAASPPPARRSTVEVTAPAVPASSTDERRWTEISGVVESLVGRTLILRSDEGRVAVDLSALSQNIDRAITPGAQVRVYGVPVEVRFKAMGFFDPGTRP